MITYLLDNNLVECNKLGEVYRNYLFREYGLTKAREVNILRNEIKVLQERILTLDKTPQQPTYQSLSLRLIEDDKKQDNITTELESIFQEKNDTILETDPLLQ